MTRAAAVGSVPWVGAQKGGEGEDASGGERDGEAGGGGGSGGGGGGVGGGAAAPPVVLVAGRLAEGHDLAWRRGAARWQSLDAGGTVLAIAAPQRSAAAPPEGPELRWPAAAPVESGTLRAPRPATEGLAEPDPSPSPSPRRSPAPPQPAAGSESSYNPGRQSTPVATLPYLDARFASLPLALAPLLVPLWLLGSSAYFQPRRARRARPGARQPHAAWWRRAWAWLVLRVASFKS